MWYLGCARVKTTWRVLTYVFHCGYTQNALRINCRVYVTKGKETAHHTGKMFCIFLLKKMSRMCSREYYIFQRMGFGFAPPLPPPSLLIPMEIVLLAFGPLPLEFPIIIPKSRPNDHKITRSIAGPHVARISWRIGSCWLKFENGQLLGARFVNVARCYTRWARFEQQ